MTTGLATPDELIDRYLSVRSSVRALALEMIHAPTFDDADDVVRMLSPRRPDRVAAVASCPATTAGREAAFEGALPEHEGRLTLAETINRTLVDVLAATPMRWSSARTSV